MQERVTFTREIVLDAPFLFKAPESFNPDMAAKKWNDDAARYVSDVAAQWEALPAWNAEALQQSFEEYLAAQELGVGAVMSPLRFVLTAAGSGPGVFEIADLIGKTETLRRIAYASEQLSSR